MVLALGVNSVVWQRFRDLAACEECVAAQLGALRAMANSLGHLNQGPQ
jgi:hypothetical protein